jgi:alanine-synthesizing transaminase
MRFSRRVPADLAPNRLSAALASLGEAKRAIVDLTESNPTRAGFAYPPDLLAALADPRGLVYRPEPFGMPAARQAIAADFERRRCRVDPERVAVTASTSEGYSFLFKALCDPGDEVLVPRPSYPLFEHLTRLDAVTAVTYDLEYHGRWSIDFPTVEAAVTDRTKAVLVVNPNNPTGNFVSGEEIARLAALCDRHGMAIISDEVFADYPVHEHSPPSGLLLARTDVLGFTLGGLSKSVGLPQAKLGWIVVSGSALQVAAALARLELVCDTYLSVATPVQAAAADLLERGGTMRQQIRQRIAGNYQWLLQRAAATPAAGVLHTEAGWYAVLRVPSTMSEEALTVRLLIEDHVLVHPGYFFDFPSECFLVVSLLPPADAFRDGASRILRHFDCTVAAI